MAENSDISVVTFNIGNDKKPGGLGKIPAKEMINELLSNHRPSLLYLQENDWVGNIEDHVPVIKDEYKIVSHSNKEATVLYRKDVLKEDDRELLQFFEDAFEGERSDLEAFKKRASFSQLTETRTSTGKSFIAISWHGESTNTTEIKVKKFEGLIRAVKKVNSSKKLPVVLGGDFNINLVSVRSCITNQGLQVYEYVPKNRWQKDVIDFFVVTPDAGLSDVKAFGGYMKLYMIIPEFDKLKAFEVFDHDPVHAKISFVQSEGESTSDGNEKSLSEAVDGMTIL